jgi:nicotinate-nucleotide adenylyltransferase
VLASPGRYARRLWAGRRVGLLGGSFNPAHDGHRHISLALMHRLELDAVWWLVSPQNPLKSENGMAPFAERLAGAAACARHPRIVATGIEKALGTRFTADTLAALARHFPETRFVWLMGADNLLQIGRWNHWTRILEGVPIAVHGRAPYSLRAARGMAAQRFRAARMPMRRAASLADAAPPAWIFVLTRGHPASATALRRGADGTRRQPPGHRGR